MSSPIPATEPPASGHRQQPAAARPKGAALTLNEAAEALGVHYMTAYRYVRTGVLRAEQVDGQWQVMPAALDDLRRARSTTGRTRGRRRGPDGGRTAGRRRAALTERLLAGDEAGAWRILDDAIAAGTSLDDAYVSLLAASMRVVGDRWEAGEIGVGDEHRASVVAMRLVGRLGARASRPGRTRGTVVLSAAPGDRHGLPVALLADLLRSRGARVVDLGADTPAEYLAAVAADEDRLAAVGICVTTPLTPATRATLHLAVRLVHERVGVPVLLGGSGLGDRAELRRLGADHQARDERDALAWFERRLSAPSTREDIP